MVSANRDKSLLLLKIRGARSDRHTHTRMDARKNERTIAIPQTALPRNPKHTRFVFKYFKLKSMHDFEKIRENAIF